MQGFQSREFTDNEDKLEQIFSRQHLTGEFEIGEGWEAETKSNPQERSLFRG